MATHLTQVTKYTIKITQVFLSCKLHHLQEISAEMSGKKNKKTKCCILNKHAYHTLIKNKPKTNKICKI